MAALKIDCPHRGAVRSFGPMKPSLLVFISNLGRYGGRVVALALGLSACQSGQTRLDRLEAVQQQQARELAHLHQQLADKEEAVARLETCVDDLENAVYEDVDSVAYDEALRPGTAQL